MLSKALGIFHPDHCRGIHVNMLAAAPTFYNPWHMLQLGNAVLPCLERFPIFASAEEISWLKDTRHFESEEAGKSQLRIMYCLPCTNVESVKVLNFLFCCLCPCCLFFSLFGCCLAVMATHFFDT